LFADNDGRGIKALGGWDSDAEGWNLTKRAFLALDNEGGDYVLLAPDEHGVALRVVFCDHEIYSLHVIAEDIEAILNDV